MIYIYLSVYQPLYHCRTYGASTISHPTTTIMDLATLLHGGASTRRAYTETYAKRSLQAPLSPPMEDQPKCSLPSISTLLEGADGAQHSASEYPDHCHNTITYHSGSNDLALYRQINC